MRTEILQLINSSKDSIDLGKQKILDAEIEEIATLIVNTKPNTKEIFLHQNFLSDAGAKTLANKLSKLGHLITLDLQANNIDVEGANAIYSLLKNNKTLAIYFRDNNIHDVEIIDNIKNSHLKSDR